MSHQLLDKCMEGEWKQFVFKRITTEDHPKILEHLHNTFYKDELCCQLLEFGEPEFGPFDAYIVSCLNQNDDLSFYAEDKVTGKVAAVRITHKRVNTDKIPMIPNMTEKLVKMVGFVMKLKEKCNTFERYGITYYASFLLVSVDPEFRQQGLATEMYTRSLGLLKERGYPLCQSVFSSSYTRKTVEKLGFEEIARLYLKDYRDDEGDVVFPNATPEMFSAVL